MVKVKFYENGELGSLNVLINKDKQFMFDATNLCKTLDIKEVSYCNNALKVKGQYCCDTLPNNSLEIYVDEENMLKCIIFASKVRARKFITWLTTDIMPDLRASSEKPFEPIPFANVKEDIHFKMEVAEWTMRVLEMNKEEKLSLVKPIMKQVGL